MENMGLPFFSVAFSPGPWPALIRGEGVPPFYEFIIHFKGYLPFMVRLKKTKLCYVSRGSVRDFRCEGKR